MQQRADQVAWFTSPLHPEQERRYEEEYEKDIAPKELSEYDSVGCFPPKFMGYVVCFLVVLEGALVWGECSGIVSFSFFEGLDSHNPFARTQWAALAVLALGDVLMACAGAFGLYLSGTKMLYFVGLRGSHSSISSICVASLFYWRIAVTLLTAPFVGIMLAFEPQQYNEAGIQEVYLTFAYVAVNVAILWVLLIVYRVVVDASETTQVKIDTEIADERRQLIADGYAAGPGPHFIMEESEMFLCLPLDVCVAGYSFASVILALTWFIDTWWTKQTIGGWLFPIGSPAVQLTSRLEAFVYGMTALVYFVGLMGIVFFRNAREQEYEAMGNLNGLSYSEDLEYALKVKRRSLFCILAGFISGLLRYALFIPITGMSLVAADVCGFYVRGIASVSLRSAAHSAPMHCTGQDLITAILVIAVASLDAYFMWGYYRLWRHYRCSSILGVGKDSASAYGAMSYDFAGEPRSIISSTAVGAPTKEAVL